MPVADVGCDHLESQLPLQPSREVSRPRAEIQHESFGRQPSTHLLHQLTCSPLNRAEASPFSEPRSSSAISAVSTPLSISYSCLARRSITASSSDFNITRLESLRRSARPVP